MKTLAFSLGLIAMPFALLSASPPNFKQVSKQANWVAHIDFQSILKSKIGSHVFSEIKKDPNVAQQIAGLKAALGIDVENLGSASAYGSGNEDEAVILAKGGINSSQIEGFASLNENVQVEERGNQTIYSFKKGSFCKLGPDSVIMGSNMKLLGHGLDVLSGKSPAQSEKRMTSLLNEMVDQPMALMTMHLTKVMAEQKRSLSVPEAALLKKTGLMGFALGESGQSMRMAMVMQAENEETAVHLENILRGASSLMALGTDIQIQPELDEILPKMKSSVSRSKKNVGMMIEVETDLLLEKISEEMQRRAAKQSISNQDSLPR